MVSAICKRYKGSELGNHLVAAGLISEDSVDRALKGKQYTEGLRYLNLMYKELMRQLLHERTIPREADDARENLMILRDTEFSQESHAAAHAAHEVNANIDSLVTLFTHLGTVIWQTTGGISYLWRTHMQNVHAIPLCNWDEYVASLGAMLPWVVPYDNSRYGGKL